MTNVQHATFGAGCFWCVDAVFRDLKGIEKVEAGYANGHKLNPTYKEVCTGRTGHAEVLQITFDPKVISYAELVDILFHVHDPTTLNRQGNDRGTQYRSGIYYHNEEQRKIAEEVKQRIEKSDLWANPIVTEIKVLDNYFGAEEYHQNYYNLNPNEGYCSAVVGPKVRKFREKYKAILK
ncbi:MAG: peptide-methionine (S)-S-oxide reductase MsrA [Aureispira sp.]|nr:peptide-methionine (S)-S-oxide reductase MsrA [Aureispira sp.]